MALEPIVIFLVDAPSEALSAIVIFAEALPFPVVTPVVTAPKVKSPPMFTLEYRVDMFRELFAAKVPPFMFNEPPLPMAFTPPIIIVPALIVNPPL